jgi:hypothetical protein
MGVVGSIVERLINLGGALCSILGFCWVVFEGQSPPQGASGTVTTPWWAMALLGMGVALLITGWVLRASRLATVRGRPFPVGFLGEIERLCADEHEIALRTQIPFPEHADLGSARLERRDNFRDVIRALEAPCQELGLTATLRVIRSAIDGLQQEQTAAAGYHAFNRVSQSLKGELEEKWHLVPASGK